MKKINTVENTIPCSYDENWEGRKHLYQQYKIETGEEPKYTTVYKDFRLGSWCSKQRQKYNQGQLSSDRIQKLTAIGFPFEPKQLPWEEIKNLYQQYKIETGEEPKFLTVYKDLNLGHWWHNQRQLYKQGQLSSERIQKLSEVGFPFELKSLWEESKNLYQQYKLETGEEPKFNTVYKDYHLGSWCSKQRQLYNQGKLSSERIQKLTAIGFPFEPKQLLWEESKNLYQQYKLETGEEPKHNTVYKDINLGYWCNYQRQLYNQGQLSSDRFQKLTAIGFSFEPKQLPWEEIKNLYQQYKIETGEEPKFITVYKDFNLGHWWRKQRQLYNQGKLSSERIQKLAAVGFPFESRLRLPWEESKNLYQQYKLETDEEPTVNTVYKGYHLGLWCRKQRRLYKQGQLSSEQIQKLAAVGLPFGSRRRLPWEETKNLYQQYKLETGEEPQFTTVYKGFNLGSWCNNQRQLYKQGKLSSERIQKLSEVGFPFELRFPWEKSKNLYQQYKLETGEEPQFTTVYKDFNLGYWCSNQRQLYKQGKLSPERIQKLTAVGFPLVLKN